MSGRLHLGINCHVVSYAATGIPVVLKFGHEQHVTVMDTFNNIMRDLFGVKGSAKLNISSRATLGVDHGYLLREQLVWWLEIGEDILGTIMRGLKINPFTFGKDDNKRTGAVDERPQNISPESFRTVHQKNSSTTESHCRRETV